MLRRYHITLGATTTAGGVVKTATSKYFLNGALLAVEGDLVDCPACRSQGVIQCVQPRIPDSFNGKQYALSEDLCICKCSPSPRLVASQTRKCQTFAFASSVSAGAAAAGAASAQAEESLPLRFINEATGRPHANRPYRIQLTNKLIEGVTNADGFTKPLSKADRAAVVAWNVIPEPNDEQRHA